ncbi:hypothetical protein NPIL_533491, partial [Nephila pilipes]
GEWKIIEPEREEDKRFELLKRNWLLSSIRNTVRAVWRPVKRWLENNGLLSSELRSK